MSIITITESADGKDYGNGLGNEISSENLLSR